MDEKRLVPELRFPEFREEWIVRTIDHITSRVGDGIHGTPAYNENGSYYFVNGNNLENGEIVINDNTKKVTKEEKQKNDRPLNEQTILLSINGTIGNLAFYRGENIMLGKSAAYINVASKHEVKFVYNYLSTYKAQSFFKSQLTGSTIKNLSLKTIRQTKINLPIDEKEQQKIATFLTSIDERIQLLEKKKESLEDYKKGIMQKIFSQEIRFKDEKGKDFPDWEKKRLEEVLNYEQPTKYLVADTEYKDEYDIPVLTAGKTFLLGFTNETKGVFRDNLPTIIFDDFTTAFQFVDFPFKAKSSAMKMLIPKTKETNMKFIFEAMKTIKFPLAEHKRYWISEYQKEKISYPCIDEQQKIASFLSSIDESIEQVAQQIEHSKTYKKGILQKMFV